VTPTDNPTTDDPTRSPTLTSPLFTPTALGSLELPNHLVMAPITRNRAGADGVPTESMTTYYAQRAAAGLIVTEGTGGLPHLLQTAGSPGHPVTPSPIQPKITPST
jgi:N-ethylmaleimide reductase